MENGQGKIRQRKPDWLKIKLPKTGKYGNVYETISNHGLHTICTSGKCPNLGECWDRGTATLMIAGNICTRACKFCAVNTGQPLILNPDEPKEVANFIKTLQLRHVVLTSVDRDDLVDKGANHWSATIREIKMDKPSNV
jgi:lipoic acid synthetase